MGGSTPSLAEGSKDDLGYLQSVAMPNEHHGFPRVLFLDAFHEAHNPFRDIQYAFTPVAWDR